MNSGDRRGVGSWPMLVIIDIMSYFRWLRSVMNSGGRGRRGVGSWPMLVIIGFIAVLTLFALLR